MKQHLLYKNGDSDAPDSIKDSNGEIVLALCRVCGRGEAELDEPCVRSGRLHIPGCLCDECHESRSKRLENMPSVSKLAASSDPVHSPPHYTAGSIEVITAIEDWRLGFHLGNVIKYVVRSPHKGSELTDLRKAKWYLERKIKELEAAIEGKAS